MGKNSGEKSKKFGSAGTKRGRFNPNPTACSHPSCTVAARTKAWKAMIRPTPVIEYQSRAKPFFEVL